MATIPVNFSYFAYTDWNNSVSNKFAASMRIRFTDDGLNFSQGDAASPPRELGTNDHANDKYLDMADYLATFLPLRSQFLLDNLNANYSGSGDTYTMGSIFPSANDSMAKTYTNPSRSLNSAFQISTWQDAEVSYSVDVSCTMSLTSGQSGTVVLEYADNSGFTTNVKTVARATNSNSGTLTIGLGLTQGGAANLAGVIPAGKYVRIRTVNNTGTPTFTLQSAQEVLL